MCARPTPNIYAIDFGTSNSLLAAAENKQIFSPIALDAHAKDPTVLRSILYYPNQNEVFFGSSAIQEFSQRDMSGRLIRSIKKFLPTRNFVGTFVDERPLNLEDIIGRFLLEMRQLANKHFDTDVTSVVLGRPARFSANQEDDRFAEYRLERSARNAGFTHIEFCPEPVAAAREFRTQLTSEKLVFVADFGGGTSDFTLVRLGPKAYSPNDVLAVGGVSIAGDALDGTLMRHRIAYHFGADVEYKAPFGSNILRMPAHLMERICSPAEISILRRQDTLQFFRNVQQWALESDDRKKMDNLFSLLNEQLGFKVFEEIERVKRELSENEKTTYDFRYPGIQIKEKILRKHLDEYFNDPVTRILDEVDRTLNLAGVNAADVDLICCTGGTANVPLIKNGLTTRFGQEKMQSHKHFHSVVEGLAERAREIAY
jgi:hypothetical chaperone protein